MALLEQSPLYRELVERCEQRGIAIGEQRSTQRVATNLLQMGLTLEQIARATGLSREEIAQLQNAASEE